MLCVPCIREICKEMNIRLTYRVESCSIQKDVEVANDLIRLAPKEILYLDITFPTTYGQKITKC